MIPSSIRRMSYAPAVRWVVQRLHLGGVARRFYCRLLSRSGALKTSCLGITATFKAHNYRQLAFVDSILTTERAAIETTLRDLKPGDVFLDVGCHYGIYSVLASKLVGSTGRVFAVEPHPGTLEILRENLSLNGSENVHVLNVALTDTTGSLALSYNENGSHRQRASDAISTVHIVQAVSGDELLTHSPVPTVIKIDVEGHEFAVLCGLKRTLSKSVCRRLCLEIHPHLLPSAVGLNEIMSLVRSCGFEIISEIARPPEVHVIASRLTVQSQTIPTKYRN
jgi:FkbM family methyltransferase